MRREEIESQRAREWSVNSNCNLYNEVKHLRLTRGS